MKSSRTNYVLLSVFIILVLVVVFFQLPKNTNTFQGKRDFLQNIDATKVKKIQIIKPDSTVTLEKKDNWMVNDSVNEYLADSENIDVLLQKIVTWKEAELASKTANKQDLFEVSESKGLHIIITSTTDQEMANFWIGKTGTSWQSQYVRLNSSTETLLVKEPIKFLFDKKANEFRDKTIFKFEASKAVLLAIKSADSKITLSKENNVWLMSEPASKKADNSKVESILQQLSTLKTNDFGDKFVKETGYTPYGLEEKQAFAKIYIKFADGSEKVLYIGKQKEDAVARYARVEGNEIIFMINQSVITDLLPKAVDLEEKSAESAGTTDVNPK